MTVSELFAVACGLSLLFLFASFWQGDDSGAQGPDFGMNVRAPRNTGLPDVVGGQVDPGQGREAIPASDPCDLATLRQLLGR